MGTGRAMTSSPEHDPDDLAQIRELTQQAIDATSTAYTHDAGINVEKRLRSELSTRGLEVDDDEWVAEAAHTIRSGHHVVLDTTDPGVGDESAADEEGTAREARPGSLGGDNGGG